MKSINRNHLFKPRNYLLLLATLLALAAGYYFLIALPAHNREKIELERQLAEAEERQRQLQMKLAVELNEKIRKAQQDRLADEQVEREKERLKRLAAEYAERQAREERELQRQERERQRVDAEFKAKKMYLDCMEAAEKDYWEYVKLNGGREHPDKPGVYLAPQWVFEAARKRKQDALDECERLHRLIKE